MREAAASASAAASGAPPGAAAAAAGGGSGEEKEGEGVAKPGLRESFMVLASSLEIRCLAVMSLAQGLCTSLMEFAWKSHMRLLYPSPSDFTAFLGDVATWTGVVTASLMLASPLLFERMGWRGVASATPQVRGRRGGRGPCLVQQRAVCNLSPAGVCALQLPQRIAALCLLPRDLCHHIKPMRRNHNRRSCCTAAAPFSGPASRTSTSLATPRRTRSRTASRRPPPAAGC